MKGRQRKLIQSGRSKGRSREWAFYIFEVPERPYCRWSLGNNIEVLRVFAEMGLERSRQSLGRNGEDGMDWFTGLMHPQPGKSLEECLALGVRLYLSPVSFPPLSSKFFLVGGAVGNLRKELKCFSCQEPTMV